MKHFRSAAVIIILIVGVLIGSLSYYFLSSPSVVKPCPNSFAFGHYNLWAGGSSTSCLFGTTYEGNLTGGFRSNASLDFFVQTDSQYQENTAGSIPIVYQYALQNISSANLNVPLSSGSYDIVFYFTYSYPCTSPLNGTGISQCGYTALNITQNFVVKR